MADAPENANAECVGPSSELAGKADSCAGCPNKAVCASAPKGPDPDMTLITDRMARVGHKVVVLSGKGGVGKSTFASTLAYCLAMQPREGGSADVPSDIMQVGLVDVDICGPSAPRMLGVMGEDIHQSSTGWQPVYARDNLGVISVGFLLNSDADAVIWRGPRKNEMIKRFLRDVDWSPDGADGSASPMDYLVFDAPPGTSDEHLAVVSCLRDGNPDGCVVVTTPQEMSLADVRKEINFCRKVGLKILGLVENMGPFTCPGCSGVSSVFAGGTNGVRTAAVVAEEFGIEFLGSVPLDPRIAMCCDNGESFVEEFPEAPAARAFGDIVARIREKCEKPTAPA